MAEFGARRTKIIANRKTTYSLMLRFNMRRSGVDQLFLSLTIDVEHHIPHGRTDRLMETKPHFSASTQRMIVALWRGEK